LILIYRQQQHNNNITILIIIAITTTTTVITIIIISSAGKQHHRPQQHEARFDSLEKDSRTRMISKAQAFTAFCRCAVAAPLNPSQCKHTLGLAYIHRRRSQQQITGIQFC
jgi:hypothetical protein